MRQYRPELVALPGSLAGLRPHRHRAAQEDLRLESPRSSTSCTTARNSVLTSSMGDARPRAKNADEGSTGAAACSAAAPAACVVWRATAARNAVVPSEEVCGMENHRHGAQRSRDVVASDPCHLCRECNVQFMSLYRHVRGHHITTLLEPTLFRPAFGTTFPALN